MQERAKLERRARAANALFDGDQRVQGGVGGDFVVIEPPLERAAGGVGAVEQPGGDAGERWLGRCWPAGAGVSRVKGRRRRHFHNDRDILRGGRRRDGRFLRREMGHGRIGQEWLDVGAEWQQTSSSSSWADKTPTSTGLLAAHPMASD